MFEYRTVLGEQYPDGPTAVGIPQATLMASPALTYDSEGLAVTVDVNGDHYPDIITEEKIFINPGTGDFTGVRGFKYWKSDADGAVDYTGTEYTPLANFDVVAVAGVDIDMDEDEDVILSVSGADVDGTQFGEADQHLYVMHNRGNGLLSTDETLNGWWGAREAMLTVTIPVAGTAADVSTADEAAAESVFADEAGVLAVEIKKLEVNGAVELAAYITVASADTATVAAALTALDVAGLTTQLDNAGGTLVPTAAPKVTGGAGPHKAYESLGLGAGRVPTIVKKMDVDGDGDLDLIVGGFDSTVSGYVATKPMLWVNPKGTSTALDDASNWKTFDGLSNSVGGTADIEVVDFDGDGDVDLVFTDGSSSIKYLLDASATGSSPTAAEWVSNTASYAVQAVPLPGAVQSASHLLEVEDMNNDGYMDLVFAGTNKIAIYFAAQGGMTTAGVADVSLGNIGGPPANTPANTWVKPLSAMSSFSSQVECGATTTTSCYTEVGSLTAKPLTLQVSDVDGDGYMDIVASYETTHKRIYYGQRVGGQQADTFPIAVKQYTASPSLKMWKAKTAVRFGPTAQDSWVNANAIKSLEIVDLDLDGNLDMVYAATGQPAYVATGRSVGPVDFDFNAEAYLKSVYDAFKAQVDADVSNASPDATINVTSIVVGAPTHDTSIAGTENSECRAPGDDFIPVTSRLHIDFPVVPCTKEDFKDCILLDPVTAVAQNVNNGKNQGLKACSYTVDLHRIVNPAPSPPPPSPPPPSPSPPPGPSAPPAPFQGLCCRYSWRDEGSGYEEVRPIFPLDVVPEDSEFIKFNNYSTAPGFKVNDGISHEFDIPFYWWNMTTLAQDPRPDLGAPASRCGGCRGGRLRGRAPQRHGWRWMGGRRG